MKVKKALKKLLAVGSVLSIVMTVPGVSVLADEIQEEMVVSAAEDPEQRVETAEILDDELTDMEEVFEDISDENDPKDSSDSIEEEPNDLSDDGELIGAGEYTVGDGVTATFDEETGAVEFYSDGGTLWENWQEECRLYDKITSIRVASGTVYLPEDCYKIFVPEFYASSLKKVDLNGFNTSNVTDMSYMFEYCDGLVSLDLSGFDTTNVKNMSGMFEGCSSLTDLDLRSFDTSNVTSMMGMFYGCSSLASVNVGSFNISNVTSLSSMFSYCSSLTNLDLSDFNTSNITNMDSMFSDCSSLVNLDLSGFDMSSLESYDNFFNGCYSLNYLKTPKSNSKPVALPYLMIDESDNAYKELPTLSRSVTLTKKTVFDNIPVGENVTASFDEMTGVVEFYSSDGTLWRDWLEQAGFDTGKVQRMTVASGIVHLPEDSRSIFSISYYDRNRQNYVSNLCALDLSRFDSSNVISMKNIFYGCNSLENLDLSSFDTSNVTDMSGMFSGCRSLTNLNFGEFDTSNVIDMSYMFTGCESLEILDLSRFDTSNVENMCLMFKKCSNLTTVDLSSFNTSKVERMNDWEVGGMFQNCSSLISLDLSMFDTSKITDMTGMFYGCSSLTDLDLSGFNTSNVEYMQYMFYDCSNLSLLDLKCFDTPKVTRMDWMFRGCSSLSSLDLSGFDTSCVKAMDGMFSECNSLETLDVSSFDTSSVTQFRCMFFGCNKLTELDLRNFDTSEAVNIAYMFSGCSNLRILDISSFNISYIDSLFNWTYEDFLSECTELHILKSPKENDLDIYLPITMYDEDGNEFNKLPINTESVILTREKPVEIHVGDGVTATVDEITGRVELNSDGGTLWKDWFDKISIPRWEITSLKVASGKVYLPEDSSYIFRLSYYEDADWENGYAGQFVSKLNELDLNGFDTSKVMDMHGMFLGCTNITELNMSKFDTSNVKNMYSMFNGCCSLKKLDLSSFSTPQVTGMEYMFCDCSSLTELNLNSFDTSIVEYMEGMFSGCRSLLEMNLTNFDTSNVVNMDKMFFGCQSLTELELSSFDTSNVEHMYEMFQGCEDLKKLNLSSFDLSKVTKKYSYYNHEDEVEEEYYIDELEEYPLLEGCSSLLSFRTPQKNSLILLLPVIMYDELGNEYTELATLSKSITLTKEKPATSTDISDCSISLATTSYTYNGKAKKPTVTVKNGDMVLTSGTDYTVSYSDNINAGTATVKVTGKGNYKGEKSVTFTINKADAKLSFAESVVKKKTTDAAFANTLTKTTDGTVTFKSSDTKVSTVESTSGIVTIKGIGTAVITATASEGQNYKAGSEEYTLTVEDGRVDISGLTVTLSTTSYTYNGKAKKPNVTVKNGDVVLISGTDYTVSYADNTNAGTATVTVTGKGNYNGEKSITFTINKADAKLSFTESAVTKKTTDAAFTNALTKTTDGTVTFTTSDQKVAEVDSDSGLVTIKGIGTTTITASATEGRNYKAGCAEYTLTVEDGRIDISGLTATLSVTSYTYDGKAKQPTVTVKNGDAVLTSGTDYTVSYVDNTNAGTATVKLTGTGNYKGEKSVTFTINKADAKLTFAESTITKKTTDSAFTNTLTKTTDGTVTFKSGDTKVATVDSTSGLVTIKGAGTTTITATASEGQNYKAGSAAYTLTIEAPAPTPTPTPAAFGFSDVQDPKHAYYKAIYWAAEEGITKGYPDGTFGINKSCTRGEMIMFLWRYAGKPAPNTVSKSPFKDVSKTHAFYKAILWASQKGITKGYSDGTFGINRNVSRGECMMFLWRLKGKPAPKAVSASPFKDVPKSHAFFSAILWGYQKKITTGYTSGAKKGTFGINENCTRGQIVTFLYRAK